MFIRPYSIAVHDSADHLLDCLCVVGGMHLSIVDGFCCVCVHLSWIVLICFEEALSPALPQREGTEGCQSPIERVLPSGCFKMADGAHTDVILHQHSGIWQGLSQRRTCAFTSNLRGMRIA